jgi:hypothetical protein
LETSTARESLPRIQTVINCPIAIDDGFDGLRILNAGYHAVNGGVLVIGGGAAGGISLRDAVAALTDLLNEFDFQTPADRSRALAALISPALVFGGLISGRVPADVAEADQSQSGKTYRQKLIAAIYNEVPYVIAKRDGGVGGLDESFSQALISARPFIQFDNLRGKMDSQTVEAYFTSDHVNARVPHRGETLVSTRSSFVFKTSNGVETTRDFANRSSIVRIRKREGHHYKQFPEGDLLAHVRANQPYYLGCVFSVLREWLGCAKPKTLGETRHDFVEWAQTLNAIVVSLFSAAPLLDGHRSAQERVSNPALNFLRSLCLAAEEENRLQAEFTATDFVDLSDTHGIKIPGQNQGNEQNASRQVGVLLSRAFANRDSLEIDGFSVSRDARREARTDGNGYYDVKTYRIVRRATVPQQPQQDT